VFLREEFKIIKTKTFHRPVALKPWTTVLLTGKTGYYPYPWTSYPCPSQRNPYQ